METQKNNISTDLSKQETKTINGQEFVSIQSERWRTYEVVIAGEAYEVTIEEPKWLFVRPSGSHTVIDKAGTAHYIPSTFIPLSWFNEDGEAANF